MSKVSIIIPAYNAGKTLTACLDSLRAQTFGDWEAFVIDDVSTDDTVTIASNYAAIDARIHLVPNPGKGPSDARNYGAMTLATGELLAFCDADDLWSKDKLSQVVDALEGGHVDAVFGRVAFFRKDPERVSSRSAPSTSPLTIQMLLGENPVCTMSNLSIRRDSFLQSGGFNPDMVQNEDLDFLVRLVGHGGQVIGLNAVQVFYRTSQGGLSANLFAMRNSRNQVLETARQFGVVADPAAEAIYLRYLARRALRLGAGRTTALRLTLKGLSICPQAFLFPMHRGVLTAIGAGVSVFLPSFLNRTLFQR